MYPIKNTFLPLQLTELSKFTLQEQENNFPVQKAIFVFIAVAGNSESPRKQYLCASEHQLPVISGLLAKTASLTQGDYI
jgi:hypothetical protein